jgi:LPXTG-motif cell wall-anchored protein
VERGDCSTFQDTIYNTTTFLGAPNSDEDSVAGVLGQTTLEMKDSITYEQNNWNIVEGWDVFARFGSTQRIWGICSAVNDGYPYLLWEYSTNPCVPETDSPATTAVAAKALAKTGSTATIYLALVPMVLAIGGLLLWLGRGRRSKGEPQ